MRKTGGVYLSVFIFVFSVLLIGIASAAEFPRPYNDYVNDYAGVFSSVEIGELQGILQSVRETTTAEVVVVAVNSTGNYDISEYAVRIGQEWGVGKSDKDNGLVIVYSADANKIFVATGYGLEGILPDSKVGRLLDEYYVPQRNTENAGTGIVDAVRAFAEVINDNADEVRSGKAGGGGGFGIIWVVLVIFLFLGALIYLGSQRKRKKGVFDFLDFLIIDFLFRIILYSIIFRGGRSSGSGGGGGFGGGGFGGGGSGR